MGPFTVQLPIVVDEVAERSEVMGECRSVWLERRGGESSRLVVVLEVIDLREGEEPYKGGVILSLFSKEPH